MVGERDEIAREIAREQEYFDRAARERKRMRQDKSGLAGAGADKTSAAALKKHGRLEQEALGGDDEAVAFGRFDLEPDLEPDLNGGERFYIGKHMVTDPDRNFLVIAWQAKAAQPYYRATPDKTLGVTLRRSFECTGNRIDDFADLVFGTAARQRVTDGPDAALLGELGRQRTGRMRDIVRTIQAAQYELIQQPPEQLLVIEGAPGTGKTAIALHRVSWLLYHRHARDILVVGPHPTFTRYIETVLPGLGNDRVEQVDIGRLAPEVRRGRRDPQEVARIKGDARMAGLLARALEARIGAAEPAERFNADGRFVTLPGAAINEALAAARSGTGPYSVRRLAFRDRLGALLAERGVNARSDALLNRLWPQLTAAGFLRDLFNSRDRLLAAAGSEFTADEVTRLRRRAADRLTEEVWSRDDLPLLDEAEHLLSGSGPRYDHIVVDEAQDLSPMQLRSVARRSATGSMTIVGDLAQSTGAWAHDSWSEVVEHLPKAKPHAVQQLIFNYRVPSEVIDFVKPLLAVAAPAAPSPRVVRGGPAQPVVHRVSAAERAGVVAMVALAHAKSKRFVGIVCPDSLRREVEEVLAANDISWSSADRGELGRAINLVSPQEAKGLEFDAVIVAEPEEIVAGDPRGHRLLYVAMTRTIGYLDVVCAGEPLPLRVTHSQLSTVDKRPAAVSPALPHQIAAMLRVHPDWRGVLEEASRLLSAPRE